MIKVEWFAKTLPAWPLGLAVVAIACIAGFGLLGHGTQEKTTSPEGRQALSERFGSKLFLPVLVPVVTGLFATFGKDVRIAGRPVLQPLNETVIGLGIFAIVAVLVGVWLLRTPSAAVPLHEGRRLTENIGLAAVLPQLLATLGLVFATAGVGKAIGDSAGHVLPKRFLLATVVLYCLGMAVFTIIMSNAFAAFPVMTAAIGYPLLIQHHGGELQHRPSGLLELKSDYAVIRQRVPTAVPLWACNVALMYSLAF